MRLYYSPGACSLASHIVLRETGANFSLARINTNTHLLEDGTDFYAIAPKGQVPLLETGDGHRISEGPIVMQFIADQMGASSLLPPNGAMARIKVLEWCNYLTSEIHKSFTPIFHGLVDATATEILKGALKKKLVFLDSQLKDKGHLTGDPFTIADAYLFVLLNWTAPIKLDISDLAHLKAFMLRVATRPAVQEAMKAEGLRT